MTDSSAPLVSIVIPCYNQAHYLAEAIESALGQTHRPVEVIVVDDGSRDNVAEVLSSYATVHCVRQKNRGRSEARNAGFRASCGEYVDFLDADDRLTPNAIAAHLRCFSIHPNAGFVVGDIDQIASDGSYIYSPRWPLLEENFYQELLRVNHVANTIAVLFRRSLFEILGGFSPLLHAGEDYELLLRAARISQSAHHPTVVAHYRRYVTSTSREGALMLKAMHRVMKMQLPIVNGDPRLEAAWRQGDRYWRDRFGPTTIKQLAAHLRRGKFGAAGSAVFGLLWYVRGRLFLLPWIYRREALGYVKNFMTRRRKVERSGPTAVTTR